MRWTGRDTLILGALVTLAAVLRAVDIGHAYDVFIDELFYLGLGTSVRLGHIPPHIPPGWGDTHTAFLLHPPGYFVLLALWQSVTGTTGDIFHQIYAARGLNVVMGALTVGLLYAAGRRLGSRWTGASAAALVAVDPYILRQNGLVLLETATLFWVLAGYFVLIGISQGRHRRPRGAAVVAGVFFGLAILTKDTATIETLGALAVLFVLRWGIPRRLTVITALTSVLVYSTYVIVCAEQGILGSLVSSKTLGLRRLLGLVQITGFNRPGSASLSGTLASEVTLYAPSYLLTVLGTLGAVYLLRSRREDFRILGVFVGSAAALLAYAVMFGTIEEQFLYFLAIPAILSVAVITREGYRRAVLRGIAPAAARGLAICAFAVLSVWGGAVWVHTRTTPDNADQRAVAWLVGHVPHDTPIAFTSNVQYYTIWTSGLGFTKLGDPARMAADGVRYVVISSRLTDLNYSRFVAGASVRWYEHHSRRVFSFTSQSEGTLGIYETTDPAVW